MATPRAGITAEDPRVETEGTAGLLFMGLDVELLVVVVVELLVVEPLVVVSS